MTATDTRAQGVPSPVARRGSRPGWIAVAVWAAGIAAVFGVGWYLRRAGLATEDALPPLHARARSHPLTWRMAPGAAAAAALVAVLPRAASRLRWRALLAVAWAGSALWAVALAASDGWAALARPLDAPTEYPAGLAQVRPDPLEWLRTFTERLGGYTTHVRGHPPLPTLTLWALEKAGLPGTGWAAAFVIASGASAVAAIAVTLRCAAGERAARAAVPFLVLAPLALWVATAMDAFFLAVGAWGTALAAVAAGRARLRSALPAAAAGGLLLGCLPYLSYGLLPLFAVPLAVLAARRPRPLVLAALGAGLAVAPAAFTSLGFWWPDGVRATLDTYLVSRGSAQRSFTYFLFGDLAVLGLLTGPAVAYALPGAAGALRRAVRARAWSARAVVASVAFAALLGTLVLDVSGVTKGEVERIWVPFAAWLVVAAPLARTDRAGEPPGESPGGPPGGTAVRGWLAAQAVTALAVQAVVLSPW